MQQQQQQQQQLLLPRRRERAVDRPLGRRLRYCVANGNSADLIRRQFRVRQGWSPLAPGHDDHSARERQLDVLSKADFVWCQYRSSLGDLAEAENQQARNLRGKLADEGRASSRQGQHKHQRQLPVINHFDANKVLTSKAGLLETLQARPEVTSHFAPHACELAADAEAIAAWRDQAQDEADEKLYIVKPGAGTNRGVGIFVARSRDHVAQELTRRLERGTKRRSWVVQDYIERPLLVRGRKFDIRCFALLVFHATDPWAPEEEATPRAAGAEGFHLFLHEQAYVRTSSKAYSTRDVGDRFVHLTNDAVQSKARDYGSAEAGNKLSLDDLARVLDETEGTGSGAQVQGKFWPQIRRICEETFRSAIPRIQPSGKGRRFELFGLDFMVTDDVMPSCDGVSAQSTDAADRRRVQLIEVNENPCLERVCPLLAAIIPKVIQDTFAIVLDSGFFFLSSGEDAFTCADIRLQGGFEKLL